MVMFLIFTLKELFSFLEEIGEVVIESQVRVGYYLGGKYEFNFYSKISGVGVNI